jgi:type IV pilus assembly protein PilZ
MGTMTKNPSAPVPAADLEPDSAMRRDERRSHDRFDVEWAVDCIAEDTFLYAAITNISAMGIFVKTTDPLAIGTRLVLAFAPPGYPPFKLEGEVAWINPLRSNGDNPNPGIGVRFVNLLPDDRERLVEVIRTIAYVREPLSDS